MAVLNTLNSTLTVTESEDHLLDLCEIIFQSKDFAKVEKEISDASKIRFGLKTLERYIPEVISENFDSKAAIDCVFQSYGTAITTFPPFNNSWTINATINQIDGSASISEVELEEGSTYLATTFTGYSGDTIYSNTSVIIGGIGTGGFNHTPNGIGFLKVVLLDDDDNEEITTISVDLNENNDNVTVNLIGSYTALSSYSKICLKLINPDPIFVDTLTVDDINIYVFRLSLSEDQELFKQRIVVGLNKLAKVYY